MRVVKSASDEVLQAKPKSTVAFLRKVSPTTSSLVERKILLRSGPTVPRPKSDSASSPQQVEHKKNRHSTPTRGRGYSLSAKDKKAQARVRKILEKVKVLGTAAPGFSKKSVFRLLKKALEQSEIGFSDRGGEASYTEEIERIKKQLLPKVWGRMETIDPQFYLTRLQNLHHFVEDNFVKKDKPLGIEAQMLMEAVKEALLFKKRGIGRVFLRNLEKFIQEFHQEEAENCETELSAMKERFANRRFWRSLNGMAQGPFSEVNESLLRLLGPDVHQSRKVLSLISALENPDKVELLARICDLRNQRITRSVLVGGYDLKPLLGKRSLEEEVPNFPLLLEKIDFSEAAEEIRTVDLKIDKVKQQTENPQEYVFYFNKEEHLKLCSSKIWGLPYLKLRSVFMELLQEEGVVIIEASPKKRICEFHSFSEIMSLTRSFRFIKRIEGGYYPICSFAFNFSIWPVLKKSETASWRCIYCIPELSLHENTGDRRREIIYNALKNFH